MFHLQIGTWNKTVSNDQFGNSVFHLEIGTRNKTVLNLVLNDQFGNSVFYSGLLVGRGKKSQISREFQGQIRGKNGRFHGKFAGIFNASFAEK